MVMAHREEPHISVAMHDIVAHVGQDLSKTRLSASSEARYNYMYGTESWLYNQPRAHMTVQFVYFLK